MLNVQKYLLSGNSLDDLNRDLGIKACHHESLPLVILNYNQIESPKTDPIVRECRGLTLCSSDWSIAAKSMNRFFNWGEVADEMSLFDFSDFCVQTKEDGSLVLIYNWQGQWHINTRGSFALDRMQFHSVSWRDAVIRSLGLSSITDLDGLLDPSVSYVCEFCSPWNKVVRTYQEPRVYLLTAFRGETETSHEECDLLASENLAFFRPDRHVFSSIEDIQSYLTDMSARDQTYEGVVIRDCKNSRWKIKSPTYLSLHRIGSDKDNLLNPKNLLPFVLSGEKDELLTYFSEARESFEKLDSRINDLYSQLESVWQSSRGIVDQKEFALAIKDSTPFAGILFSMRKHGKTDLSETWRESGELILRFIKSEQQTEYAI